MGVRGSLVGALAALIAAGGCNHSIRPAQAADAVGVWPVTACPSAGRAGPAPVDTQLFLGGVGELFLGTLLQAGADHFSAALAAAAAEDKNGTAVEARSARYLYTAARPVAKPSAPVSAVPAGCLVVVVAAGEASPAFCDNPGIGDDTPALQKACGAQRAILDFADCDRDDERCGRRGSSAAPLPKFYAEIELRPATDLSAVRPVLVNLHYATAFNPRRSGDRRDIAVSVQLSSPDGKAVANVMVAKAGLVPADRQDGAASYDLTDATGLWTVLPKYRGIALADGSEHRRVGAVNVAAEVRETGRLNEFLQAFAAAFAADRKKTAAAISGALLPGARQDAAAAELNGKAAVLQARAALEKANSDYETVCSKAVGGKGYVSDTQKQAELRRQKNLIEAAWQKLRAAQLAAGAPAETVAPAIPAC